MSVKRNFPQTLRWAGSHADTPTLGTGSGKGRHPGTQITVINGLTGCIVVQAEPACPGPGLPDIGQSLWYYANFLDFFREFGVQGIHGPNAGEWVHRSWITVS